MRILQVAPYFHPHVGGVESHVRDISLELIRRRQDIEVLTPRYDPALHEREKHWGIPIRRSKALFTAFSTPMSPKIGRSFEKDVDIVHVHSPPPFTEWFTVRGARRQHLPVILTHHCDLEIPSPVGPLVTGMYRRTFGSSALAKATRIVVTTESYARTSNSVWRYNPTVIPNTVDVERFKPGLDASSVIERERLEGRRMAMYVGRIVFHKGLEYFIQSAQDTPDDMVHLIVGTGPKMNELKQMARKYGVAGKVRFAGYVTDEDLPLYYTAANVLVLPSVSRLEAFGIVGLEAMATGTPVVLSNIPGVKDVITHGKHGYLAEPLDSKDIARKIDAIISDPGEAAEMAKRARQHVVKRFSLRNVGKMLIDLYREVIREHEAKQ